MPNSNIAYVLALASLLSAGAAGQTLPAFAPPVPYAITPIALFGSPVFVSDLDGDGRGDVLALGSASSALVGLYRLSNPNGTLGPQYTVPSAVSSGFLAIADFGDGTPDFISVPPGTAGGPLVELGLHGARACGQAQPLTVTSQLLTLPCSVPGSSPVLRAVRGSSLVVALADPGTQTPSRVEAFALVPPAPGAPAAAQSLGPPWMLPPIPPWTGISLCVCNVDGDSYPDFVFTMSAAPIGPTQFRLVRGTAAGFLQNPPTEFLTVLGSTFVQARDLTGDGRDELIISSNATGEQTVYRNDGPATGSGEIQFTALAPISASYLRAFGDLDADGDVDAICSGPGGIVLALLNDGTGNLIPVPTTFTASGVAFASTGDLDADGDLDIVLGGSSMQVLLNQSRPSYAVRPGTPDAVALGSDVPLPGTAPSYTHAPIFDFKTASSPVEVALELTAPAFAGRSAYLVGEVFPTGCPPTGAMAGIYVSVGPDTVVMGPYTLAAGGHLVLSVPAELAPNLSAIVQFVTFGSQAANGAWAATEAHEIQF